MNAKEAADLAKKYVAELFAEEGARNIGLEELEYDEDVREWSVTVGFSRPWDEPRNALLAIAHPEAQTKRSYKIVRLLDIDRSVLSVRSPAGRP